MLLRKLLALMLLALVVFGVSAQDDACSILTYSYDIDGGNVAHITLYAWDGSKYVQSSYLTVPDHALFVRYSPSNEHVRFPIITWDDAHVIDFYAASASSIDYETRVVPENRQPIAGVEWSSSGRFLAVLQYYGNFDEQLHIYDTVTAEIYEPTDLRKIANPRWSPAQDVIAFIAHSFDYSYDASSRPITQLGVYVTEADGTLLYTYPINEETFARFQWLSGTQLALTDCIEDSCQTHIVDITTGEAKVRDFGPYVPEAYVAWRDSYIVSLAEIPEQEVGLWNERDGFRAYARGVRVISQPLLSDDGRHLAVQLYNGDSQRLLIVDLFDSKLWRFIPLEDELPDFLHDDAWFERYPQYFAPGQWHPLEQKFLYTDSGAAHVFDTTIGTEIVRIEQTRFAQWVCPAED